MMNLALPGLETECVKATDIVMTDPAHAREIVQRFKPTGRILDPFRGDGAFWNEMPGAEWCEIREGRDFFAWREPVDWIVSNPPYSIFSDVMRHAFGVARDIVFLIPINKTFNSFVMMRDIWQWGGVPTMYVMGTGAMIGLPVGFATGAVHFQRGYRGPTAVEFRIPNAAGQPPAARKEP